MVTLDIKMEVKATLDLDEEEIKALYAITLYGEKAFKNVFFENLGSHYLGKHSAGIDSLFKKIRSQLPEQIDRIDKARKILEKV